jgi:mercuric ion binding protein
LWYDHIRTAFRRDGIRVLIHDHDLKTGVRMKNLMLSLLLVIACLVPAAAQDQGITEAEFRVSGNCSMCKTRIEKAVSVKGVKFARWNKSTKMLKVAFLTVTITADSLQRRLAAAGHDTDAYRAQDAVYEALPECCLYRGNSTTH